MQPTVARPQVRRIAAVVPVAALAGTALGVVDLLVQRSLPYPWAGLANSSAVWAVAAFALGRRIADWLLAAVSGVVMLGVAVEVYYLAAAVIQHDSTSNLTSVTTGAWLCFAVVAGTLFGGAGSVARTRDGWTAAVGTATAGSVLYAEALVVHPTDGAVVEAVLGVLTLLVAGRSNRIRARAFVVSVPMAAMWYVAFTAAGFGR